MIIRHNVPPPLNNPPPPFPSPMVAAVWAERKMMWEDERYWEWKGALTLTSSSDWCPPAYLSLETHSSIFTSCDRSSAPILFQFSGVLLNHLQDYFLDCSQAYEEAPLHMDRTPPGLMSASNLHSSDRDKDGGWERRLPWHCHGWCWTSGGTSWNKTPL